MDADSLQLIAQQLAELAVDLRKNHGSSSGAIKHVDGLSMRLIYTRSDLIDTFNSMQDKAVHSIDALDCGERPLQAETQAKSQPGALKRGVRYRVVYDPVVFEREDLTRAMLESVRQGENARVSTNFTNRLLIRDREEFIVHTSSASPSDYLAVQFTSTVLAEFINIAFAKVWDNALQVSNRKFETGTFLDEDEVIILRLLAAGQKDESVARALGVSVRTVQRKIQNLQRNFGAASRFQLGAISSRHLIVDNHEGSSH